MNTARITAGNARSSHAARGLDPYDSGPEAAHALVETEGRALPHTLWEPACGQGDMVNVFRQHGHEVFASDIDTKMLGAISEMDFLRTTKMPNNRVGAIVTNPPFKLAAEFAAHALSLCPRVYLLLRLNFLEAGSGPSERSKLRSLVLDDGRLTRVMPFRNRLPRMHHRQWTGKRAAPTMPMAWFVWDTTKGYRQQAVIQRISWKPTPVAEFLT